MIVNWNVSIVQRLRLLILMLLLASTLFPKVTAAQSGESPWVIYKEEDGLASNSVWKILPVGNEIWFGTENGISRFDGGWRSWQGENFVPGSTSALAVEADNTVWAGTDEGYVVRYSGGSWEQVVTLESPIQVLNFVEGILWIGTSDGLFRWNGTDAIGIDELNGISVQSLANNSNAVWVGTNQGLWIYQRQTWSQITVEDGLPSNDITTIWLDDDGPVWVGTTRGVARREATTGTWLDIRTESVDGQPYHITALMGDEDGDVWGGTARDGAFRIIEGIGTLIPFSGDVGLTTAYVQTLAVDSDGSIWVGTASGIFRYDQTWVKELRDAVNFPGINTITALMVDQKNQVWIGTQGAGIRLKEGSVRARSSMLDNEQMFNTHTSQLPDDRITTLLQDEAGNIWAGTANGVGLFAQTTLTWTQPFRASELPSALVNAMIADQGALWIGTEKGLAFYEIESDRLTAVEMLAGRNVQALIFDSMHRLWVGTQDEGIFIQDSEGEWQQFQTNQASSNTISGNAVVAFAVDSSGIWAGIFRHGLNYWNGKQWVDYAQTVRLPSNLLYTLYTDPMDSSLWIGSEGGVTHYDGRTWETLSVENVLPNTAIFAIARTHDGSYWFGSKDGLTFYEPERSPPWVRLNDVTGRRTALGDSSYQAELGETLGIRVNAGDLRSPPTDLDILYRINGTGQRGEWLPVMGGFIELPEFETTGAYVVEFQARDQAFNYSNPLRIGIEIIDPPATVRIPIFGDIRQDTFVVISITSLIALFALGYMSLEILQSRRRAQEAVIRGFNPFVSGEPVRRQDMFFGRHDLLQRIIDTLHNNSIMIHGERRIGKTTLLYQLAARLREVDDAEYWFVPLYIDLEGTTEDIFFHFLMEEILNGVMTLPNSSDQLAPSLSKLLYHQTLTETYTDREFSRDMREVIAALQAYSRLTHPDKHLRMILLLDEMDVMSSYNRLVQQRLRRIFMRDFAATLGAVVAGIQISKEWDRVESPWYNLFNEIELGPFGREQAIELLTEPIRDIYRYEPAALEFIIDHSDGRPFRLQQHALEAVNHMLADGRRVIALEDVEYANQHIQQLNNDMTLGLNNGVTVATLPDAEELPAEKANVVGLEASAQEKPRT